MPTGCLLDRCHSICQPFATQPCMSAGVVLLYMSNMLAWCLTISSVCCCGASPYTYLLVWCLIIRHALWCGASLSAIYVGCSASLYVMRSGVVPHCKSCLLVSCLTISHACWCGTSLSAMAVGVVPPYRPFLLARYLTIAHACSSFATATNILLVDCR